MANSIVQCEIFVLSQISGLWRLTNDHASASATAPVTRLSGGCPPVCHVRSWIEKHEAYSNGSEDISIAWHDTCLALAMASDVASR